LSSFFRLALKKGWLPRKYSANWIQECSYGISKKGEIAARIFRFHVSL